MLFGPPPARAQNAPGISPQGVGGSVTGRAVCADTQHAARFAQVTLIPATADDEGGFGRGRRLSARTDLDGVFSIAGVPQGDYFVTGQLTGYINEAPLIQAALSQAASSQTASGQANGAGPVLPADVTRIRVGSGGASAVLSLQRGAVIAGSAQWDDGSPAAGVGISAVPAPTTTAQGAGGTAAVPAPTGFGGGPYPGGGGGAQTDDRGHFRLSGLAPGTYLVRANVQAPAPAAAATEGRGGFARTLNLSVYAPDKLRRTEAATVTVAAGEERDDLAITLNLRSLHTVAGSVGSSSAPVRSGTVSLTDQTDSTLNRSGTVNPDGTFAVAYVPAGNYTLRVNGSSQASSSGRGGQASSPGTPTAFFQPLQESLTVTDSDLTGLSLNLTVATPPTTSSSTSP